MENQYFQSEIHRLLKLGPDLAKSYQPEPKPEPVVEEPAVRNVVQDNVPFDLPYKMLPHLSADDLVPKFGSAPHQSVADLAEPDSDMPSYLLPPRELSAVTGGMPLTMPLSMPKAKPVAASSRRGSFLVYPLVFAVSFAFFYVILNFNALMLQAQGWFSPAEEEQILEQDLEAYQGWIGGYYFSVGDREKLEPNNDIDADGLTNLDEYTIKTNPTMKDSDSDGITDGIEVINGTNPWGSGNITATQRKSMEQLDMIMINNRISFNAAAGNGLGLGDVSKDFDLTRPGRLSIPKLNMQVPIIWTQSPADFDADLTRGTVHYPGTALPGQNGMMYVSGHSSDYFWKNHPYKQVFARINSLDVGDDVFVEAYGLDGKTYNFKYRVTAETIYAPDDQRQFIDNTGAKLNLSTCWPIGTQKDRYVVTAELIGL